MAYYLVNNTRQPIPIDASVICNIIQFFNSDEYTVRRQVIRCKKSTRLIEPIKLVQLFFSEVEDYKDASGANPFLELYHCAISVLTMQSLLHSNPEIERVFISTNQLQTVFKI